MKIQDNPLAIASPPSPIGGREEFSLTALLTLFWHRRRVLLRSLFIGLVVSITYAYLTPSRYQSTVSLMPPDPTVFSGTDPFASGLGGPATQSRSNLAGSFLGESSTGDLFLAILQSRTVQDDLINQFGLMRVYGTSTYDDARKILAKNTDAKEEAKSKVIFITVTDKDRHRAQSMANAYVTELNRLVSQVNTSGAHRERVFLENRLPSLSQQLDAASKNLSQFSSRSATLDINNQGKAIFDATAKLQGELIAAKADLSGLQSIYAPQNERVRAAEARVAELTDALRKMGGIGHSGADSDNIANQLYPSLRELPLMGSEYMDLSRRVEILESVYEILTKDYELAKVEEAREIPTVKVIDPPELAERRSYPRRTMIVAIGLTITFLISATWIYVKAAWDGLNGTDPRRILICEIAASARRMIPTRKKSVVAKTFQ